MTDSASSQDGEQHDARLENTESTMNATSNTTDEQQSNDEKCVVCGSENHDGEGWIYPPEDHKIVGIKSSGNGVAAERELTEDAQPICSIDCKEQFEEDHDI